MLGKFGLQHRRGRPGLPFIFDIDAIYAEHDSTLFLHTSVIGGHNYKTPYFIG